MVCLFLSGWLQEAYFLKTKSNNNKLCILRTKCSPSQTLDDDPHNVWILHQRRWCMVWQKELIVLALQGMKFMHVFLNSLSCLCSTNSGPLDNNRRDCNQWWAILAEMFLTNSWQNVAVTMGSMNQYISIMFERCQFKSLWKLMIWVHIRFVNF